MTTATPPSPYAAGADLLPALGRTKDPVHGVLTALYVILLGPAVGLVWGAVGPKLSIPALAANSDAAFHALIGADAWFLLVGGLAGALVVLVAVAVAGEPGPGVAGGTALGGQIGAFVADRVGYLSQVSATKHALLGAHPGGAVISEIDFRIRALGVVTVWPLASLLVVGVVIAVYASSRR